MFNTVTVFMSTYNGEKYLREQIDSIIRQKDVKVSLWIRDDGSVDETLEILSEYEAQYSNIHVKYGESKGVGMSFMQLLYEATEVTDFYAFSDQDDIWDEDKLIAAMIKLRKEGDKPRLYACNQRCVDSDGLFISNRFPDHFPEQRLINELFCNLYAGCTMVFNQAFKDMLCAPQRRPELEFFQHRIHDAWLACVATSMDALIYDPECHMSFRRHNSNVSDSEITRYHHFNIKTQGALYLAKIKRRICKRNNKDHGVEFTARYLLEGYDDFLANDVKEILFMVRDYRYSIRNKFKLLFGPAMKYAAPEKILDHKIKVIINKL